MWRANLHRGEAATWSTGDGSSVLQFRAGLGITPPVVYLPGPKRWAAQVPRWATDLRPRVVADFEALGAIVEEGDLESHRP